MIDLALIVLAFQRMIWISDPCYSEVPRPTYEFNTNSDGDMEYHTYTWDLYTIRISNRDGEFYQEYFYNSNKLHEHPNLWNLMETDYIYQYVMPRYCSVPVLDENLDNY